MWRCGQCFTGTVARITGTNVLHTFAFFGRSAPKIPGKLSFALAGSDWRVDGEWMTAGTPSIRQGVMELISSFYKTLYVFSLHRALHRILYKPLYVFALHRAIYRMERPEAVNRPISDTRDTLAPALLPPETLHAPAGSVKSPLRLQKLINISSALL